jgi:hypothetical protein
MEVRERETVEYHSTVLRYDKLQCSAVLCNVSQCNMVKYIVLYYTSLR